MKKILLFTLALVGFSAGIFAQTNPFTPGSGSLPGFTVGTAYQTVINISVPTVATIDPSALGLPTIPGGAIPPFDATVDTVKFTVSGLPAGLTAAFDNGTGVYLGGATGTLTISGTPTSSSTATVDIASLTSGSGTIAVPIVGSMPISFPGTISLPVVGSQQVPAAPGVMDGGPYTLSSGGNAVEELDMSVFDVVQNIPNPFSVNTQIKFSSPNPDVIDFKVFDMLGKQVYAEKVNAETGVNYINFNAQGMDQGAYFFTISNG